jgi:hypothetical protein
MSAQGTTLTLTLQEDANGLLKGTLTSTTGVSYNIEGQVSEGVAVGVCADQQGGVYFEAYFADQQLIFSMIEPDEYNMPDYNKVQTLTFNRSGFVPQVTPQENQQPPQGQTEPALDKNAAMPALSVNEFSDPSWGFSFRAPEGWSGQMSGHTLLMGHQTIPGLIAVWAHQAGSLQEVQQLLQQGLNEEQVSLSLSGTLQTISQNAVSGEYSGTLDGTVAKARCIGTSSPFGGGAIILAVTTPEKYGEEQRSAAAAIASGMKYFNHRSRMWQTILRDAGQRLPQIPRPG